MTGKRITIGLPFEWHKIWSAEARVAGLGLGPFIFNLAKIGWEVWKDQKLGEQE